MTVARHFVYISVCLGVLVFTPSCKKREVQPTRSGNGGIQLGGNFRMNMVRGNPNSLDPIMVNSKVGDDICLQIFDRLITLDSALTIVPEIANRWEVSPDGLTYTFHLRSDIRFHDNDCFPSGKGRLLTARDVEYSLTRVCTPRSVGFWAFKGKVQGADKYFEAYLKNASTEKTVTGFRVVDDTTFQIQLLNPYAPFLNVLLNALGCVVPQEAVEKYGEQFGRHPVGSGAFKFSEWKEDDRLSLIRNGNYWQSDSFGNSLPYLDGITVRFIKDDKTQLNEFMQGNLDESFSIPTEMMDKVLDASASERRLIGDFRKFQLQAVPGLVTWFMDFNCSRPPFDNVNLRRAICAAVDRDRIVTFVLKKSPFKSSNGIVPPVIPWYDNTSVKSISYDPAQAREFLKLAGYAGGKPLPTITLTIYPEPRLVQTAEAVQQMLKENLGIEVEIETIQFAELLTSAEAGQLEFWGTRWYGDYPDPENFLVLWDGALVPKNPSSPSYPNSSRYQSVEYVTTLNSAMTETNPVERAKLYLKAEQVGLNDSPSLLLFYDMHYRLLQPTVRNYPLNSMARFVLKSVWFTK